MTTPDAPITIRPAYADDQVSLARLATLDSADEVPPTPLLIAEVDGELRAALSLRDDTAIADPFHRTSEIVELLRTHATAAGKTSPRRRRRLGLRLQHA
jgi:hypothetical protein